MTSKPVTLHRPQSLVADWDILAASRILLCSPFMFCSPPGAIDPVPEAEPPNAAGTGQCFQTHPAVPHGDTDSVTSAPLHPLTTCTQHEQGFILCKCLPCLDYPTSSRQSKDDCNKSQLSSCSQGAVLPKSSSAPHHTSAATVTAPQGFPRPPLFFTQHLHSLSQQTLIQPREAAPSVRAQPQPASPREDKAFRASLAPN